MLAAAVPPRAAAQTTIRYGAMVGKNLAGRGTGRIARDVVGHTVLVIAGRIPVIDPLPDIAGHIVETKGIRAVAGLVGCDGGRPVIVGLVAE